MKDFDIIIHFAVLWGENIGSASTVEEWKEAQIMKKYDSEELLVLFSEWKDTYMKQDIIDDACEFFEMKRKELISKEVGKNAK